MNGDLAATAENWLIDHHVTSIPYGTGAGHLVCNQFVVACIRASLDPSFPMISADEFASAKVTRMRGYSQAFESYGRVAG